MSRDTQSARPRAPRPSGFRDSADLVETSAVVEAARAGDDSAFTTLTERYRRELQLHCYRMLGSFEDSEDLVQETFLRAWRNRGSYAGRSSFRAWLYRIATNACLDALDRRKRVVPVHDATQPLAEVPWLQPYPDPLLEGIADAGDGPEAEVVAKETVELAFIAAIQLLPPRQRAVLIARDILHWSAAETAELLDTSITAANSALQRARATMKRHLPESRLEWTPGAEPSREERALLERYMEATEQGDPAAMVELLREDALFSMPPQPQWYVGAEVVVASWVEGGFGDDAWGTLRCIPARANRQPAVANYVRRAGDSEFRPLALDVLRLEGGRVTEIIAFPLDPFLEVLGLPRTLR